MSHLDTAYQYGVEEAIKRAGYSSVEEFLKEANPVAPGIGARAADLLGEFGRGQLGHMSDLAGTLGQGLRSGFEAATGGGRTEQALAALKGLMPSAALGAGGLALYNRLHDEPGM